MENTETKVSLSLADIASMLESYQQENGGSSKEVKKLEKAIKGLKDVEISKKKQQIKEEIKIAKQQYKDTVKSKKEELKDLGSSMILADKTKDMFGGFKGFFTGAKDKFNKAKDKVVEIGKATGEFLSGKATDVKDKTVELGEKAAGKAVDVKDKVVETTKETKRKVKNKAKDLKDKVVYKVNNGKEKLTDKAKAARQKAIDLKDKVVDKVVDAKDKAVELGGKAVDKVVDAKDKVVDTTKNAVEKGIVNPTKRNVLGFKEMIQNAKANVNGFISKIAEKASDKLGKASQSLGKVSDDKFVDAYENESRAKKFREELKNVGSKAQGPKEKGKGPNLENIKNLNNNKQEQR